MKKQAFYILAALTVMATAAITQAYGQWVSASRFDVPFDFTVSGQRFPAGSYIVERGQRLALIRSIGDGPYATFVTVPSLIRVAPEQSQLVFVSCGDHYRLQKVLTAGLETVSEVLKTKRERRLERGLEASGTETQRVVLVACR
jgi:hypothetical protein